MNFDELPQKIKTDVLHTNIPFGKLLATHQLATLNKDRTYFSVNCDDVFAPLLHCILNSTLYGRTNTLVRADNKKWIAQVVEVLPKIQ